MSEARSVEMKSVDGFLPLSEGGEDALRAAITRISQRLDNVNAASFLPEYSLAMCAEIGADYFAVGRLNPFSNIMRTLCFVAKGALADNIVYSLDGTPCADTLSNGVCISEDGVADQYPRDKELRDLNIRGYAGAALAASCGEKLGVLVAMSERPMENRALYEKLLSHFRLRVASVIEVTETVGRYAWVSENVFDGVWDWDLRTGGTIISDGLQRVLQSSHKGRGPYDLTQIEKAIHPDDRVKHAEALQRHLNVGAPYSVRLRLLDSAGVYRWHLSRGRAMRDAAGKPTRMIGGFCDIHDVVIELQKATRLNQ